jgi:SAM-dependent methyltransferase
VEYIGLDYLTADTLYHSRPDLYGNAEHLPFSDESMNSVLLLDVLEHIKKPGICMDEIHRVLRSGGFLVLNIPFLYPLHDVPHDYQRWTIYGIRSLLSDKGFNIQSEKSHGKAVYTSCLLANLAFSKSVLNSIERRHPGSLLILLMPVLVPVINLIGYLSQLIFPADDFMPYRYHLIAVKPSV